MYCMTVLFNSSSLCAFISFIFFLNACFFFPVDLIMHPPHVNVLFEVALYISHLKWIKENACFLTDFDWTISSGFIYVYCHWVRANNWDKLMKKIYQLSFRTLLDVFKNVEFERGSKFTLIFFSIFMYIVPPIQTNHLLAYLLWKCLHIEIDIKIIIVILFYFITIEPTDILANMCFVNVHLVYSF